MTIIGTGTIGGQYAGTSDFKGESEIPFLLVHIDTLEGKAIFLIQKTTWDNHFNNVDLGQSVVVQYSVVGNDTDNVYVLERIVGLE